ncbi:hypothetical protein G7Y89_g6187 [Cudoniella acicularis]|uniref:Actin-like ATPase domain-containing protein n=1 Tax=Cudoniella acicularis TaxID=354080 RepID=A0A8H4RLT3_9HELO|nr:hypothetical protein G7Y89_g6187 [Cudoniella acicularis]
MAAPANRIVIGLDYGTTYTGKFVKAHDELELNIHQESLSWPNGDQEKVPSAISYEAGADGERQWGFAIRESSLKWQWTKLKLDEQTIPEELRLMLSAIQAYCRSSEEIVADYLQHIQEYLKAELNEYFGREVVNIIPIDLVVTVPAVWSDKAKNRTCHTLKDAGFDKRNFPGLREITLMSEPEAAALHTARWMLDREDDDALVIGDCFVICDAGGGTVDCISYRVKQVDPYLQLEEIAVGTGAECGATFIDGRFSKWVEERVGPQNFQMINPEIGGDIGSQNTLQPAMGVLMVNFETVKRAFDGSEMTTFVPLPRIIEDIPDDPVKGIQDGELRMTKPSLDQAVQLVKGQVAQVQFKRLKPRYIFLAGGFGESPLLRKELHHYARQQRINLKTVDRPWLAVVLGAVQKGCEVQHQNTVYLRKCRKHYGISSSQPFSAYEHLEDNAYDDPFDGEKKAREQMTWLVQKGDALLSDTPKFASVEVIRRFGLRDSRKFKTRVVISDDDDVAHKSYTDIPSNKRESFFLIYDLSEVEDSYFQRSRAGRNGQPYFTAAMEIGIMITENDIRFSQHLEFNRMSFSSSSSHSTSVSPSATATATSTAFANSNATNSNNDTLLAVTLVNSTTEEWGLDPLPAANITFINGTLTNGTLINGKVFNGTIINGTTIVERTQPTTIGTVPLVSFIYMIMSILIIIFMTPKSIQWAKAAAGEPHRYAPDLRPGFLSHQEFVKRLHDRYPGEPATPPLPSYAETVLRDKSKPIGSEELRECRDLIRAKFALDVEAYNLRDVPASAQYIVAEKRARSRGALEDIRKRVVGWKAARSQWSDDEWHYIEAIDRGLGEMWAR